MSEQQDSTAFLQDAVDSPAVAKLRDALQTLADKAGGTFSIKPYDGGQMLTVNVPGRGTVEVGYDSTNNVDQVIDLMRARLVDRGLIGGTRQPWNLTFSDGRIITIYAIDEQQAVRLAGRGQPESVVSGWAKPETANTTILDLESK